MKRVLLILGTLLATSGLGRFAAYGEERITLRRVPGRGIQPQVAIGADGTLHLCFYRGEPGGGDLFYVRSKDEGRTFSKEIRVNSVAGSAVSAGTIRGAHLSLGKNDRVHVSWNGAARLGSRKRGAPMLYSFLDKKTGSFREQRNLMTKTRHLDGGGSVAADRANNVYVVWHGSLLEGPGDEAHRAVWVARSKDGGESFSTEVRAHGEETGACGCCGLRAFVDREGRLKILYRTATRVLGRDMHLLSADKANDRFRSAKIDAWNVPKCVMSLSNFSESAKRLLATWETREEVYFGEIDAATGKLLRKTKASGQGSRRKHPALATNDRGHVLLTWTEGTAWNRGGSLAWQLFDAKGEAVEAEGGSLPGIPVWSFPAVFPRRDEGFVVLY